MQRISDGFVANTKEESHDDTQDVLGAVIEGAEVVGSKGLLVRNGVAWERERERERERGDEREKNKKEKSNGKKELKKNY